MATRKTVTIFTGFVDQEPLTTDVRTLAEGLGRLRAVFAGRGVRLRTERWDDEAADEMCQLIAASDVCLFLFCTDLPELARTQFDAAHDALVSGAREGAPAIMVWFRDTAGLEPTAELLAFQDELDRDMGHFFNRYVDVDTVQFQLLLHLEREGAGIPFACVGTTLVDARGNVVMDFEKTAAYGGNEALRAARERLAAFEARYQELLDQELEGDLDDDEAAELDELVDKIEEATEEERVLQERFLADMRTYARELADDRAMSPRRRQAIRLITAGRVREGYELLDAREIERDARTHEARAQVAEAEVVSERGQVLDGVKSLLMRVRMLRTFVEEEGETKNAEIRQTYAVAIDFEERNGFEPLGSVGYGEYLIDLGIYDKAVDTIDAACVWYRRELARTRARALGQATVPADPFVPDEMALKRGLAHALDLMARAAMGAEAPASAAYAVSERMDLLRELYASEESDLDERGYGLRLVAAAQVMCSAERPDDALDYLDEATEVLAEACEDDPTPELLDALAQALEVRRDTLSDLTRTSEAAQAARTLLGTLRRLQGLSDDASVEQRLVRELRAAAYVALEHADRDQARALAQEALGVETERYRREPSAAHARMLSEGLRHSSVIAANMRLSAEYCALSARRLSVLVDEYRRVPCAELQTDVALCVEDLCSRWSTRRTQSLAEALLPELIAAADSLEGIAAPDENPLDTGVVVGDTLGWALEMTSVCDRDGEQAADDLLQARLRRLRGAAQSVRGAALLSGAFERLSVYLAGAGRQAEAYGLMSERLCVLRLACGAETVGERRYAETAEDFRRLRDLVHALGYAAQYARSHGRPAEGHALLDERLDLLRENFAARHKLSDAYTLNRALFEASEYCLARRNLTEVELLLEEAWRNACDLHEEMATLGSLRNLLYVGRNVNSRYRDAGKDARANEVLLSCEQQALAYRAAHPTAEVTAWVAHIIWMYARGLRERGELAQADHFVATHAELARVLAQTDATAYLTYLHHYLNNMVDSETDEAFARSIVETAVAASDEAFRARQERGVVQSDDLVTYSSVLELGILVTLEKRFDDLAEAYVSRCIALYEERPDRVAQKGPVGVVLSEEECAVQLSKELARLAASMRRFGHPERADELGARSTALLAAVHDEHPGSRASFIYSSQLYNDAQRLRREGRVEEALALREASVAVLDRYRQADPTERNVLWYTRALAGMAKAYRQAGQDDRAAQAQQRIIEVLDQRYQQERSRSLLGKYLYSMAAIAKGLQETGADDQALELRERCVRLADDAHHTYHDVESARLLSQMQAQLRRQLRAMGRIDDARDVTTKQVEVLRFLFAHNPTLSWARFFERALWGEIGRLRFLSKRLDRKDYRDRANELHSERIEVLRWAAERDRDVAVALVEELVSEITLRDPKEPWVLKSMRKSIEGGHSYPLHIGAQRARTCLEVLWILYRDEPSQQLAEDLCDMKGVLVQYLMPKRTNETYKESRARYLARMEEAAAELYELVPMLEERRAQQPDEAHTYRLTYYLKTADVAFETIGNNDDALAMLARRTEVLHEQNRQELSVSSGTKYLRALRDQAALCQRMGRIEEAARIERGRMIVCERILARDDVRAAIRSGLEKELVTIRRHREQLLSQLGDTWATERRENLLALVDLLRPQAAEDDVAAYRLAKALMQLGSCKQEAGELEAAAEDYRAANELVSGLSETDDERVLDQRAQLAAQIAAHAEAVAAAQRAAAQAAEEEAREAEEAARAAEAAARAAEAAAQAAEAAAAEAQDRQRAVAAQLALVGAQYAAVAAGEPAESCAPRITELLGAAADELRALEAPREASLLDAEARTCARSLGRPSHSWWRSGYGSIGRGWQRDSELGRVQGSLQKASLLLERSLELGDWDEPEVNHRNLRNLMGLRLRAYHKGLDAETQARRLNSLRWCLHNAARTLQRAGRTNPQLLQEAVVLRCEMLEALGDLAVLRRGSTAAATAERDYVAALKALVRDLGGKDYADESYQDLRRWAQERADAASDELAKRSPRA